MPDWGYSVTGLDPGKTAKASGRELRISPKDAREVCKTLKGMKIDDAKRLLSEVVEKKRPIPITRYRKEVPHRHAVEGYAAGRYPIKVAKDLLKILESLESNATFKGLDLERLRIIHIASQRARVLRKYIPRAHGRATPYFNRLAHLEVVVEEV